MTAKDDSKRGSSAHQKILQKIIEIPKSYTELVLMTQYDVVYYETGGPRVNMNQTKRILACDEDAAMSFAEFFCEDKGVKFIEVLIVENTKPTLHLHVKKKQKHIDVGVYALTKPVGMEVVIPAKTAEKKPDDNSD